VAVVSDDVERCPWCGEVIPVEEIGSGDKLNIMAYERWLEAHAPECEPWLKENADV
jgi:hypothetical protein